MDVATVLPRDDHEVAVVADADPQHPVAYANRAQTVRPAWAVGGWRYVRAVAKHQLREHPYVSIPAFQSRAAEFPRLAELVSDRAARMANAPVHQDTGPRVLVLLGQIGSNTHSLLTELEATVRLFDRLRPPGWQRFCHHLGAANQRSHFLSMAAELVVARWAHEQGLIVSAFEPETVTGTRPDLLLAYGSEELYVEVVAPGEHEGSVDTASCLAFSTSANRARPYTSFSDSTPLFCSASFRSTSPMSNCLTSQTAHWFARLTRKSGCSSSAWSIPSAAW
jgi:hypothetical protein